MSVIEKVEVDERRRGQRRPLPLGRIAVLEIDVKSHIVSLIDVSRGGAYLGTRLPVEPGQQLWLKLVLPRAGGEMRLACRLVRRVSAEAAGPERPQGLAIQFHDLAADVEAQLEEFVVTGGFESVGEEN